MADQERDKAAYRKAVSAVMDTAWVSECIRRTNDQIDSEGMPSWCTLTAGAMVRSWSVGGTFPLDIEFVHAMLIVTRFWKPDQGDKEAQMREREISFYLPRIKQLFDQTLLYMQYSPKSL